MVPKHTKDGETRQHQVGEFHEGEHRQQEADGRDHPAAGDDRFAQQRQTEHLDHEDVHGVDVDGAEEEEIGVKDRQPPPPEGAPKPPNERGEDCVRRKLPDQIMNEMFAGGSAGDEVAKRTVGEHEVRAELHLAT